MSSTLIAVADTVFPSLDPAREALAAVDPDLRIAEDATPGKILAVAADAEALLVTYGQINAEVIAGLNNCKVIGRFGIHIIAADPYCPDAVFDRMGVEKVELDDMLARSDYVSVHAPLTPETEKMFNAEAFKKMKPGAFLINTARGPLVDIDDLAAALDAGEIAGAALDVLPSEPPGADNPLVGRTDVILTPHTGFYSEDALLDLQTTVAEDVARVLTGEAPKYPVKPS